MRTPAMVDPSGYTQMARAEHDRGRILVLSNDSDCMLVVEVLSPDWGGPKENVKENACIIEIFPYDDDDQHWKLSYMQALMSMTNLVIRWTR